MEMVLLHCIERGVAGCAMWDDIVGVYIACVHCLPLRHEYSAGYCLHRMLLGRGAPQFKPNRYSAFPALPDMRGLGGLEGRHCCAIPFNIPQCIPGYSPEWIRTRAAVVLTSRGDRCLGRQYDWCAAHQQKTCPL